MAIKAGQILHVGNDTVVIDRIQTAGPGTLNIPTEKIYELGNYVGVATIRDTPDLTFSMESLDVSCEMEAMLLDVALGSTPSFDLSLMKPLNLASAFKAGKDAASPFAVVDSVGLPFLTPESVSYRFGLRDNARQTVGLRGDSIFYNPGSTYVDEYTATGAANETFVTTQAAYASTDGGTTRRALAVVVGSKRLALGTDYTEAYGTVTSGAATTTVTLTNGTLLTAGDKVRVMYASPTAKSYLQAVHADTTVKPAAVRGRDIDIYVGGYNPADIPGSAANKWGSVQSANVDFRVTLEKDEEFGNYFAVAQDFDVPGVTGGLSLKPRDPAELFKRLRQMTGKGVNEALGANSTTPLALDIVIKDAANSGATLKRLHVPDARFTMPGFSGRVQTKLTVDLSFESDAGSLVVYKA